MMPDHAFGVMVTAFISTTRTVYPAHERLADGDFAVNLVGMFRKEFSIPAMRHASKHGFAVVVSTSIGLQWAAVVNGIS